MTEYETMSERDLASELKASLIVLSTTSADKRRKYQELFSYLGIDDHHKTGGIDAFLTDSGAVGVVPSKTAEATNNYSGNLDEKTIQLLSYISEAEVQRNIRSRLSNGRGNVFNPETVNIVGMTEDSGWELEFSDQETKKIFTKKIEKLINKKLRSQDKWLTSEIHETGFPGPNLKLLQEHLDGGFHTLMEIIYDAAEKSGIYNLRFSNTVNIAFCSPRLGKIYSKEFKSYGRLVNRSEYEEKLLHIGRGEAINSDFVMIPDGQSGNAQTMDFIINGMHSKSSADFPGEYNRRDLTEWLQSLIGKRHATLEERKRPVNVA